MQKNIVSILLVLLFTGCGHVSEVVTGPQGIQGVPGKDTIITNNPYTLIEEFDPCDNTNGIQDEILLRMSSGALLVLYTDNLSGDNPRLSLLDDGYYMTSDGTACLFNVTTINNVRTISWSGFTKSWELKQQ